MHINIACRCIILCSQGACTAISLLEEKTDSLDFSLVVSRVESLADWTRMCRIGLRYDLNDVVQVSRGTICRVSTYLSIINFRLMDWLPRVYPPGALLVVRPKTPGCFASHNGTRQAVKPPKKPYLLSCFKCCKPLLSDINVICPPSWLHCRNEVTTWLGWDVYSFWNWRLLLRWFCSEKTCCYSSSFVSFLRTVGVDWMW